MKLYLTVKYYSKFIKLKIVKKSSRIKAGQLKMKYINNNL